jgi:hypothetical protein
MEASLLTLSTYSNLFAMASNLAHPWGNFSFCITFLLTSKHHPFLCNFSYLNMVKLWQVCTPFIQQLLHIQLETFPLCSYINPLCGNYVHFNVQGYEQGYEPRLLVNHFLDLLVLLEMCFSNKIMEWYGKIIHLGYRHKGTTFDPIHKLAQIRFYALCLLAKIVFLTFDVHILDIRFPMLLNLLNSMQMPFNINNLILFQ